MTRTVGDRELAVMIEAMVVVGFHPESEDPWSNILTPMCVAHRVAEQFGVEVDPARVVALVRQLYPQFVDEEPIEEDLYVAWFRDLDDLSGHRKAEIAVAIHRAREADEAAA